MWALDRKIRGCPGKSARSVPERRSPWSDFRRNITASRPSNCRAARKRRVAIAGILAMHPRVLVLDEPTAGLDPKGRDEILDQIQHLHRETGMTVILVSHSMEDIANYVDRIIVMNRGGEDAGTVRRKKSFLIIKSWKRWGLPGPAGHLCHA